MPLNMPKRVTAAEACERMDAFAREYLRVNRFDPRREQIRKELHELAALVEPAKDEEVRRHVAKG